MKIQKGMKLLCMMIMTAMAMSAVIPSSWTVEAADVTPNGQFQVIGTKIYDPDGNEYIARGTNINGMNWVWSREDTQDADLIDDVWNFNMVRVNNYLKPLPGLPAFTTNNDLDQIIDEFTSRHIVVMLEIHDFTNGIPSDNPSDPNAATLTELEDWWVDIAAEYHDNPYVWFNLYNEPGGAPSSQYESIARDLISAIRTEAPDNVIVVDGGYSGQDNSGGTANVTEAGSSILTYGQGIIQGNTNVIFSVHMYGYWNGTVERFGDYIDQVHAKGLAIIIGEFSSNATTNKLYSAVKAAILVSANKGIGWLTWCWVNGDGHLTATDDGGGYGVDKINGDKPTNLTWFGDKVWDYAHGQVPDFDKNDLSITEVVPDEARVAQGDEIRFAATLLNTGDFEINGTVKVNFLLGGQIVASGEFSGTIPRFGAASIVSDGIEAPSSNLTVTAEIDSAGSTYGSDDDSGNNERTLELIGGSPGISGFDLVPVSISLSQSQVNYGDRVNIDVSVMNQGDTASPYNWTTINFYVNGVRAKYVGDTVSIPAGGSHTFTLQDYLITQTKDFALAVSVDYKNDDLNHENDKTFKLIQLESNAENVNLVLNSGFESGTAANWQFWGGPDTATITSNTADVHSGSYALEVAYNGGGYYLDLEPNTTYVLSAYGKTATAGDLFSFGVQYAIDSAGTQEKHTINFTSTDYTLGEFIFTTPDNIEAGSANVFVFKGTGADEFYLDDITLKKESNLVLDPGFESGTTAKWQFWGGTDVGAVTSTAADVHNGSNALEISHSGGGYYVSLQPNTTYVLSAFGKNETAGDTYSFGIQYDRDDAGTTEKSIVNFSSTDYTSGQVVFTTPAYIKAGTANVFVWKGTGTGKFYLDDIRLKKEANLALNAGFENGTTSSWQIWGGSGASTVTNAVYHNGAYALEVNSQGGGQFFELDPNTTYIVSANGFNSVTGESYSFGIQYNTDEIGTNEQHTVNFFNSDAFAWRQAVFTTPSYMKPGTTSVFFWKGTDTGNPSYLDDVVLVRAPIQPKPPTPSHLEVTETTASSVVLSWDAGLDNGSTVSYSVYRNNEWVGQVEGNVLAYEDTGLASGTTYTYTVKAVNGAGNLSDASNEISVTTNGHYEAEDGALTGVSVASSAAAYSGSGYVDASSFNVAGDSVTFSVYTQDAGTYQLLIRYAAGNDKPNSVVVNGDKQKITFSNTDWAWTTLDVGTIALNAGSNTIELLHDYGDYGWIHMDYIEIESEAQQ
ncbi:cellulase family glycosylhydrolase [Paenibacillus sp. HB172176]|uniref:cellulase family glycosylhydrolase n=1 Tax=Paenibacillus sp. HB172176 TaxID=2493690 RepID=UPI00143B3ACB|nr:cellulase family glycosylhydrolase [Paenibacillus sp. HB172176]